MIKELTKLATHLDLRGLSKEANYLDAVIRKMADDNLKPGQYEEEVNHVRNVAKFMQAVIHTVKSSLNHSGGSRVTAQYEKVDDDGVSIYLMQGIDAKDLIYLSWASQEVLSGQADTGSTFTRKWPGAVLGKGGQPATKVDMDAWLEGDSGAITHKSLPNLQTSNGPCTWTVTPVGMSTDKYSEYLRIKLLKKCE